MLFDSHSHIHDSKFDSDRAEVLLRARAAGVAAILTLGDTIAASRSAIALAESSEIVYAAAGVHPCNAAEWQGSAASDLDELLNHDRVIVLGEIGLDYYWQKDEASHRQQDIAFREQLLLARAHKLPVSIHCRESTPAVLDVLEDLRAADIGGVLHCFSGTQQDARRALNLGFFLGVGGTSTYPATAELRETLRFVGLENLLVETDSPYLPPQSKRGKRNEPAYVAETAERLSETLGHSHAHVAQVTYENTLRAFRLNQQAAPKP